MSSLEELIQPLKQIAFEAGDAILKVYNSPSPIKVDSKTDDSPVTQADYAAHHIIEQGLNALHLEYPVLSEEGGLPSFDERSNWQRYWLVDPLDGTKEFINRNDEFTVNIALIDSGKAILGMVYVPVTGTLYYGIEGFGSFKEVANETTKLNVKPISFDHDIKIVGSRRHGAEALEKLLEKITPQFKSAELVSMGSSLKICALAEGSADWYPRLALTSEWDTAAAHAVLSAAGGQIVDDKLNPLKYNTKESLLNPYFHAFGDSNFDWEGLIKSSVEIR